MAFRNERKKRKQIALGLSFNTLRKGPRKWDTRTAEQWTQARIQPAVPSGQPFYLSVAELAPARLCPTLDPPTRPESAQSPLPHSPRARHNVTEP